MSARGYVCLLLIDLYFPEAGSLKAKRAELRPLRDRLARLGLSVAEVDHHDRWQRATLAASLSASQLARAHEVADAAQRLLDSRLSHGARVDRVVLSIDELLDAGPTPAEALIAPGANADSD